MAGEIPQYFLLQADTHYIVTRALIAVKADALPAGVKAQVDAEFAREENPSRMIAVKLPGPGDSSGEDGEGGEGSERTWVMMAAMRDMGVMEGDG